MDEPYLVRLQAPSGETRMVDARDLSELDRAWILENFEQSEWWADRGYLTAAAQTATRQ